MCKNVLKYFGKVQRKLNVCIIRFDWLIALYLFFSLVCKESFIIVKNSGVREELSDINKSLCKNILLMSSQLCISTLVRAPPQLILSLHLTPLQRPGMCAVENFQRLRFGNSWSPDKFIEKRKHTNDCLRLHLHCAPSTR